MLKLIAAPVCAVVLYLAQGLSCAAEITRSPDQPLTNGGILPSHLTLTGEIKRGDYDRFKEMLLEQENLESLVFGGIILSSPGGDVTEGLKFAKLFEHLFVKVTVVTQCYSTCFILFAGGVERSLIGTGELGLHRMSTRSAQLDIQKTKAQISPLSADVSAYLLEQGIPRVLIDKMNETPASSLFRVDHISLSGTPYASALEFSSIYIDAIEKACGHNPDPFPGKSIREAPRDSQSMAAYMEWFTVWSENPHTQRLRVSFR